MTVKSDPVLKQQPEAEQPLEADPQPPESEPQTLESESESETQPEPESEPPPPKPELTRLEQLKLQKEESAARTKALDKRIRDLTNRQSAEKRKLETRKKILAGTVLFKLVETGQMTQEVYLKALDQHLTTEHDRKVFGLPGGTKPEPKAKTKPK